MNNRDYEYIDNRLSDPGPAMEAADRLHREGHEDLAKQVTQAGREYLDALREVRYEIRRRHYASR